MSDAPLAGIRVIDLSQYVPGPYTTRLLSDLGAEVIKIEPPRGDPLRQMFGGDEFLRSPVYDLLNRGKQIARLNLKDPDTLDALMPLIAEADVLVESFRPGVLGRLGIDFDACRRINERLVYCSLSGYGQDGPYRLKGGHDINYCAAAGMFSVNEPGVLPFPLVADHSGAMNAVNAVLAALVGRFRHGGGAYLDVSLYEAILSWQYPATAVSDSDEARDGVSMVTGGLACYNLYRTADDRLISLGALETAFWRNFCVAMGNPDWIERQYEALPQVALIEEVAARVREHTLHDLETSLFVIDCCVEPVPTLEELYAHPQTDFRELFGSQRFSFPAKINGENPQTRFATQDLTPDELPTWHRNH